MKNLKILSALSLVILPIIFLAGCNKQDEVTSPANSDFDSPQYLMIDYYDTENAIEEATLDTDLSFNSTMISYNFVSATDFTPGKGMLRGRIINWLTKYDWNKHLGMIFRRLNLTDEQKSKVDVLMKTYHDAMKPLVQEFVDANKETIEKANADRKAIAGKVKDGTLTRAQAAEEIKALNENTHKAIEENPASVAVKTKMCDQRKTLLDGVRVILDSDQHAKWDTAVAKMKSPC